MIKTCRGYRPRGESRARRRFAAGCFGCISFFASTVGASQGAGTPWLAAPRITEASAEASRAADAPRTSERAKGRGASATAAIAGEAESHTSLSEKVRSIETAFAKSMADRDLAAFERFLSEEAVFLGSTRVFRGRQAVAEGWKRFFEGPEAPFSWAPERVEVLESGTLALSTGPVFDPKGQRIGTFNSVWRLEKSGAWRIVLDSGCPPCDCSESTPSKQTLGK
jgi:ketosteroid isomerase-like protein